MPPPHAQRPWGLWGCSSLVRHLLLNQQEPGPGGPGCREDQRGLQGQQCDIREPLTCPAAQEAADMDMEFLFPAVLQDAQAWGHILLCPMCSKVPTTQTLIQRQAPCSSTPTPVTPKALSRGLCAWPDPSPCGMRGSADPGAGTPGAPHPPPVLSYPGHSGPRPPAVWLQPKPPS